MRSKGVLMGWGMGVSGDTSPALPIYFTRGTGAVFERKLAAEIKVK